MRREMRTYKLNYNEQL